MSASWPRSQSPVARRGRSSETPRSPWERRDISMLCKMWNYSLHFLVFSRDPTVLWEISNRRANGCDRGRVWQGLKLLTDLRQSCPRNLQWRRDRNRHYNYKDFHHKDKTVLPLKWEFFFRLAWANENNAVQLKRGQFSKKNFTIDTR